MRQTYLKLRGRTWWFRRRVPLSLAHCLGMVEVHTSVNTQDRRTALSRGRGLWVRSERVFADMLKGSLAREQARILLRHLAREEPWCPSADTEALLARAATGDDRDARALLVEARQDLIDLSPAELNSVLLHARMLTDLLDAHSRERAAVAADVGDASAPLLYVQAAAGTIARRLSLASIQDEAAERTAQRAQAPEPTLADFIEAFLSEKTRDTREHRGYTENTAYQSRLTFRLWQEAMGDMPVASVGGKEAGQFRDLLLRLPQSHGKAGKPVPVMRSIEVADARDAALVADGKPPVPRLSMKTCKRHFSAMQQLWKYLRQRDAVQGNPFSGFAFPGTAANRFHRDDWSERDLLTLLRSPHMVKAAAARGRDFWLVGLAMWSGMRLEEACRLRPRHDVQEHEGIPCLTIQDQAAPTPWSPKTEAGERLVPLHPMLIEAGIVRFAQERVDQERLIPGLRPSGPRNTLGAEPSRQFSKLKGDLGVSTKTTFHSFRHSVSTLLRNQGTHVREPWIDAVLGHEAGDRRASMGITVYLKEVGVRNLASTVSVI